MGSLPDCKSARIHMKQEKVSINSTFYSWRENPVVWNKAPGFFKHAFLQQRSKFQNILLTPDLQSAAGPCTNMIFASFFLRNVLQMKKISIYSFCPPISFRWTGREALTGRRVGCGAPERSVRGDLLRYRSRYWSFRPPVLLFLKGVKENNCFSEYIGGCPESAG